MNDRTHRTYSLRRMLQTAFCFALIFALASCSAPDGDLDPDIDPDDGPQEVAVTIRCVGDIMGHLSQLIANYDEASGTYDFSGDYEYVRDYIREADLSICNVETTFGGYTPYTGYPFFNSPDQLAFDVAAAGFDVALLSNNHMLDTKLAGLQRTLEVLRSTGMRTAGAHFPGEQRSLIVPAGDLKVGIVSYTYETGLYNGRRTLNGSIIPNGAEEYMNSFRYYRLEEDMARIARDIETTKLRGADIVVAYMHWGNEYQRNAQAPEKRIAMQLAEAGADIVFASHPHVVQEIDVLELETVVEVEDADGEEGDVLVESKVRSVPVYYSMGNFISNQRQETLDNRYTEQGMIASVDIVYDIAQKEIKRITPSFIPTWVEKYQTGRGVRYAIIPLVGDFKSNPELAASGHGARAAQALADMAALIGETYVYETGQELQ